MLSEPGRKPTSRTALELLHYLHKLDVKLWVDGVRLRCNAPQGVLTPVLQAEISEKKAEIIALLQRGTSSPQPRVDPIVAVPRTGRLPQSFAQQQLWLLDRLTPESWAYYTSFGIHLQGPLRIPVLERCLSEVIRRHEILRTTFDMDEYEPVQIIHPPGAVQLPWIDLSGLSLPAQDAQTAQVFKQLAQQPYNLQRGPLLRLVALQLRPGNYQLLLAMHHIIADGWSLEVFIQEMGILYEAFVSGKPSPLPELTLQYADFAAWQHHWLQGNYLTTLLDYWRQQLAGAPPLLELPYDRPRSAVPSEEGADLLFSFPPSLTRALRAFSQQEGVTLFMTLLAAFQLLLARLSGQQDVIIGTIMANRPHKELEGLIGMFVNTLVMRADLSGNPSFRELLQRVRRTALGAYAHQDLPFEILVEKLLPERNLSYHPMFQVLFDFHNIHKEKLALMDMKLEPFSVNKGVSAAFDLQLVIEDDSENLSGQIIYRTDLFDHATISRMVEQLQMLLKHGVAQPEQNIGKLPLLTSSERRKMLVEWNATDTSFPLPLCVHQLFEQQVAATPDTIAVACGQEHLSYHALNTRANQLARHLQELGMCQEQVVAICMPRSLHFLMACLAVFKTGASYLPLNPEYPAAHLAHILATSRTSLMLTTEVHFSELSQLCAATPQCSHIHLEPLDTLPLENQPGNNRGGTCTPQSLAYVIYTSGSTGIPKGVMITHQGMLNHIHTKLGELHLTSDDRVAQTASQCFDISVWQYLAALLVGGCVQIFCDDITHNPTSLLRELEERNITVFEAVPSLLHVLLEFPLTARQGLAHLRWMILTGEALSPELCQRWFNYYPDVPLLNAYGPTECSDDVTHHAMYSPPLSNALYAPIGRPVANTQAYVLDRLLDPVPVGVIGEFYIGGIGVGRGYIYDPQRTAESFLPDPFAAHQGARLYKTGDLVKWLPNGTLQYLQRNDQQVKLRGFRIELGEIETALQQHPSVQDCIVVADKEHTQLTAYVIVSQTPAPTAHDLQAFLQKKLPAYMLPSSILFLDSWPLTPNGKVNRNALSSSIQTTQQAVQQEYLPARDTLELQLVGIWEELLGQHPIGVKDNFFALGGHSLLAVQLLLRVERRLGRTLPLASLFKGATIESMADLLRHEPNNTPPSPLVEIQPGSTPQPFFCVHPVGGSVLCYYQLAQALGREQRFYGLQAPGLESEGASFSSLEQLASCYLNALQELQPEGPYFLGGWSLGGVIAFEIARQLHQKGQQIALLALIDSTAPLAERSALVDETLLLQGFLQDLVRNQTAFHAPSAQDRDLQQLAATSLPAFFEQARKMNVLPPDFTFEWLERLFQVYKTHVSLWSHYMPRPAPLHATLFMTDSSDTRFGWESLAHGDIEWHTVPEDHFSIIHHPHALAQQLKTCLDRAYQRLDLKG